MESKTIIKELEYKREYDTITRADGTSYIDGNSYGFWETNVVVPIFKPDELVEINEKTKAFAEETMKKFRDIFDYRSCKLTEGQLKFSYDASLSIIGQSKMPDKITVIPAKAGFGKSSYIYSLLITLCSHINKDVLSQFSKKGVIIVTDRIHSLRELEKNILSEVGYYSQNKNLNTPYCYILESWNRKSYEDGVCINPYVKEYDYEMCSPRECCFFNTCKMCRQKTQQIYSPILLMTNARFKQYGEKIQEYAIWIDRNGVSQKREIVIIDEKPQIIDNKKINTELFTKLKNSIETSKFKGSKKDKDWLLNEVVGLEQKVMKIRMELTPYRNCIWCGNRQYATTEEFKDRWSETVGFKNSDLIEALDKMFYQGAVWCNNPFAKPYFCTLDVKPLNFGGFNTFIFDATSELDPDYQDDKFQYLSIQDMKSYTNITFHIYEDKIMNMSRSALNTKKHPWKIEAITKWINNNVKEKTFVVSYNEIVKQISSGLQELGQKIFVDADEKEKVIPHFGDTKGSNDFKDAQCMIQIGWNRASTDEYLTNCLSRNTDHEKLFARQDNKIEKTAEVFKLENSRFVDYDSANLYMWKRLAVDFEQEVFRTSIRDFSADNPVTIYIFHPDKVLVNFIIQRFHGCNIIHHKEIPDEFSQEKVMGRKTPNGKQNIVQNFMIWLTDFWDGSKISVSKIKDNLHVTDNYWDKLIQNKAIKKFRKEHNIHICHTGKGKDQMYYWYF